MRIRKDRAPGPDLAARAPARTVRGTGAMPASSDAELGQIFQNMRVAMQVSRGAIARRLATAVATVDTLEAGAIAAFPRWPETERIVRTYCGLLRLDPEPILWHIRGRLQPLARPDPSPVGPSAVRSPAPADDFAAAHRRRRRVKNGLVSLAAPLALVAVVLALVETAPLTLYRGIALLPRELGKPLRFGLDQLVLLTATRREGLRWVDVGDPRVRKSGRLRPPAH
jgi:hypothetical protein